MFRNRHQGLAHRGAASGLNEAIAPTSMMYGILIDDFGREYKAATLVMPRYWARFYVMK